MSAGAAGPGLGWMTKPVPKSSNLWRMSGGRTMTTTARVASVGNPSEGIQMDPEIVRKLQAGELPPLDFDEALDVVAVVGKALQTGELGEKLAEAGSGEGSMLERWASVQAIYAMAEELVLGEFGFEGMEGRARYTASVHMYVLGDAEGVELDAPDEVKAAAAQAAEILRKAIDENFVILLGSVGIDTDALPDSFSLQQVKDIQEACLEKIKDPAYADKLRKIGREADLESMEWQRELATQVMVPLHLEAVAQYGLDGEEGMVVSQYMSRHVAGHPHVAMLNMELQKAAVQVLEEGIAERA